MRLLWLQLIVLLSFPVVGEEAWQLVKSDSNVTVYTKQGLGRAYKSFKAVGIVQSTPQKLLKVLDDVDGYNQWFAFSESVRLLKIIQNEKYVYMETSFPWPFSNGDMIYKISLTKNNNGETTLVLNGVPDFIPAIDGIKRMPDAKGYILLQPEKEHTIVTYVMHTELGGDIPPWLANKYIHLLPFQTLNNLIRLLQKNVQPI